GELGLEVSVLLLERLDRLLGAADVARLLHRLADVAERRAGLVDGRRRECLAPHHRPEDGGADAKEAREARAACLCRLASDGLLGAADLVVEGRELGGILGAEAGNLRIACLPGRLFQAYAKVALGLLGIRPGAQARALPELERLVAVEGVDERLRPG